jgi:ribosomal protein S18 acetylase RimI-like enzyme
VGRFFEVYNAAWRDNWGFAPMPEVEIRHLAGQLKQIIVPNWAFGLETPDGQVVGVCLALPDVNLLMQRVRSGRLLPFGWYPLLTGRRKVRQARVWALGIRPDYQHLALGPLLYREIVDRLHADGVQTAEASWTLATNHRINDQLAAMGAHRSKVWRLYQRPASR